MPGTAQVVLLLNDLQESRRLEAVRRDFIANVSHELKTPVGAMMLLAEALRDATDDPVAMKQFTERMLHEAGRMSRLVQELLELSRLQGGEPLPAMESIRVSDVIADASDPLQVRAEAAGITLDVGPSDGAYRLGRPPATHDRADQPHRERDRLFVARLPGGRGRKNFCGRRGAQRRDHRQRRGRGHRKSRPGKGFRAVLSGRHRAIAGHRRNRSRPRDREAHREQPRRSGGALEPPRRGLDVHPVLARATYGHRRQSAEPERSGVVTHLLVIEDEESFSETLAYMLTREGFEVRVATTGPAGLEEFERHGADLVILDLMLPGLPGTEVCRRLRERSDVPVIMLTARDSEVDKVVGLELGADDYVTKPFSARELVARIRAVMRRRSDSVEVVVSGIVEAGPVRLDPDRHVVSVRGEAITLPLREFELLELLLRNAGRVLTRNQLIDRLWGSDYVGDTKTLDVHVKRLRSRVEEHPARPRHLVTVRGLGYKFEP